MYNVSFRGVLPTVACRCVWSSNLVREEAKARWRAVKYTPTMGCVAPGVEWGGEVQCTIVTCSRNHCCNGNATVCSWALFVNYIPTGLLQRNSDAGDNKQQPDLHEKCPIFLADFNEIWIFSSDFHRSPPSSYFTEIYRLGAVLIHADRLTDIMKLTGAYSNVGDGHIKAND